MDTGRYNTQVARIKRQWEALQGEMTDHAQELEEAAHEEQRGERLHEAARNGPAMLNTGDIATANAWLRRHVRVWVDNDNPAHRLYVEHI
jgi:hypothetical protein